ncbi:MAG: hypothetical protein EXR29_12325 [Betaproteobacteria bacterium]|nr:hypothetical protein [Betaproteobacteria bacterium]
MKLSLVPLVIWIASEAGRRWGHSVTGWITGLPLIAAPISIFLALDPGPEFSAQTGHMILQSTPAAALYCLAYGLAAQRFGWLASLLLGWALFFAMSFVCTTGTMPVWIAAFGAFLSLVIVLLALPRVEQSVGPVHIPRSEIVVRMLFALAIAAAATIGATTLGPKYSGILLTFPISGSVMPAFTLAIYGHKATAQLIRGFVLGLFGFTSFFMVVPLALPRMGLLPTYLLATIVAVAVTLIITHLAARLGINRPALP